jgi:predicted transcriptional regulator
MGIEDKTVSDVMSRGVHTVSVDATFSEIINAFSESKVSALIVVAPNGEFMGVISKTDIISALKQFGNDVWGKTADDILYPYPCTIEGSANIKEAARKMLKHKVHRLIVVTPSKVGKFAPVGLISATDILREFAS